MELVLPFNLSMGARAHTQVARLIGQPNTKLWRLCNMKNIYVLKEYLLSVLKLKYSGCVCVAIFGVSLIKHILYQLGHQIPSYFFFSVYKCIHLVPVHSRLTGSIK